MKKISLKLGLFLFIAGLWVFLGVNKVQAAITYNSSGEDTSGGSSLTLSITIPDASTCANPLLIFSYGVYGGTITSATYNSDSMVYGNQSSQSQSGWGYLINPDTGTHNLYITFSSNDSRRFSWSIFCGVGELDTSYTQGNWAVIYNPNADNIAIAEDNSFFYSYMVENCTDITLTPKYNDTYIGDVEGNEPAMAYGYGLRDAGQTSIGWNGDGCAAYNMWGYFVFKPATQPESNGYSNIILPANPTTGYLVPDTYTVFYYNYNTTYITNSLDYITAERCLNIGCSSTTPVIFDDGISTSTISFIRKGTSTNYGYSFFTLKSPTDRLGTSTNVNERYKIVAHYDWFNVNGAKYSNPAVFLVTWLSEPNSYTDMLQSATSSAGIFGNSTDLACTAEEWATPDPVWGIDWLNATTSIPALNFTKNWCYVKKGGIEFLYLVGDTFQNVAKGFFSIAKNTFPFNFPIGIQEAWDNSTSTLPTALSYFDIADGEGNFVITMPAEWSSDGTTTKYAVWGPSIINDTGTANANFFAGVRAFSTFIIWISLLYYFFDLIGRIKDLINPPKEVNLLMGSLERNQLN